MRSNAGGVAGESSEDCPASRSHNLQHVSSDAEMHAARPVTVSCPYGVTATALI